MNVTYREAASVDVVRQFRYYPVEQNLPDIAVRFRDAVQHTVESLRQHPFAGARYLSNAPALQKLRSWPVAGFEAIRVYYLADPDGICIIRVLHGKRDVKRVLEQEASI